MLSQFVLTALIALLGGILGLKAKIPAGAMFGSMLSVALFNLITGTAFFPSDLKVITSSLVGAFIGVKIFRKDILNLPKIAIPAIIMIVVMLSYNIICGLLLAHFSDIDITSSILSMSPGGSSEMAIVAMDLGANTAIVTSVQVLRMMVIIGCTPFMLRFAIKKFNQDNSEEPATAPVKSVAQKVPPRKNISNTMKTILIACLFGLVGRFLRFPAGALCFSMIAVTGYNIATGQGFIPLKVKRFAQISNGAMIGMRVNIGDFIAIGGAMKIIIPLIIGWLLVNALLSIFMIRQGMDLKTAIIATAAGGMTDLGILAEEIGGNSAQILAMQFTRMVGVIMICPTLAILLSQ